MALIRIEKLGGLAGFGTRSHLRSIGEVDLDALPAPEREEAEALFDQPGDSGDAPGGDRFRYRLTLESGQTIELDGDKVPERLKNSVTDRLV